MTYPRSSGLLLHIASLPGKYGIGDLGPEALRFANFLQESKQSIWQVLPLGPTGYGDSPYQSFSAFAGNPLLISPEKLLREGLILPRDLASAPDFASGHIDYSAVNSWKTALLARAHENFLSRASITQQNDFEHFCTAQASWLDPYALFMARKQDAGSEHSWTEWKPEPGARHRLAQQIHAIKFVQFEFFRQFGELKRYCQERGIRLMGDMPIYVAHDSADVFAHPELYELDQAGYPRFISGVPPDYFSATGQLWGNPIYAWSKMRETGFDWWIQRLRASFAMYDLVRLDHFRGFEAFWQVPAGETTAINGTWVKAPGPELFEAIENALGKLAIVAENLGVITPEVEALRERFGFPGMAVLQFGFGSDPQAADFRPHNFPRERVAYSGTHDNDTTVGWWSSVGAGNSTRSEEEIRQERQVALDYLNCDGEEINWTFIRSLMGSVASTVIFPVQDVLGLGSEARMNTPGVAGGNWSWRLNPGALTSRHAARLKHLAVLFERAASVS